MKVKVNRIKGNNLASLVKKMITMDSQIYLTLSDNQVSSSVFLATKDVVKKTYLGLADVFELDEPLDKPLKLAFFNGSKVISALQYFDLAAIHGEISCLEIDGEYYAEYLTIEDNSLKMKLTLLIIGTTSVVSSAESWHDKYTDSVHRGEGNLID